MRVIQYVTVVHLTPSQWCATPLNSWGLHSILCQTGIFTQLSQLRTLDYSAPFVWTTSSKSQSFEHRLMNQLTNLPSSLAEPEAAPSQRPLGPEKCSNVPPLAAQTQDHASLSHVDVLPFVTAQDAPALATVTGADVPVLVTNPPSLTAGGAVEAAAAPGAGAVASNAPTHSEVCCSRESGGEAKGAKRSRTPEYKSQQSEAAKRRRKENAEHASHTIARRTCAIEATSTTFSTELTFRYAPVSRTVR